MESGIRFKKNLESINDWNPERNTWNPSESTACRAPSPLGSKTVLDFLTWSERVVASSKTAEEHSDIL